MLGGGVGVRVGVGMLCIVGLGYLGFLLSVLPINTSSHSPQSHSCTSQPMS